MNMVIIYKTYQKVTQMIMSLHGRLMGDILPLSLIEMGTELIYASWTRIVLTNIR